MMVNYSRLKKDNEKVNEKNLNDFILVGDDDVLRNYRKTRKYHTRALSYD